MSSRTQSFYNTFSSCYPLVDFFLRPQKRVLLAEIDRLPAGDLLEIGVGNGAHLPLYRKHRVTGIDTSSEMLRIAAQRKPDHVRLLQMNGESLRFGDGHFDYVVLAHVIAVVDDPERLLAEACRVLKPGGMVFMLNHFTPGNRLRYVDHAFGIISGIFRFRSVFYLHQLTMPGEWVLLKEVHFRPASYFKLLMYQKK